MKNAANQPLSYTHLPEKLRKGTVKNMMKRSEKLRFVLSSRNKGKIAEVRDILKEAVPEAELYSLDDIGFTDEIVEDGATFEENACIKAKTIAALGYAAIADDSGLCVDALDGAPGVYSARYAGEHANDEKNNAKLLSEMKDVAENERTARFVTVVACVFPDGETLTARGEVEGVMLSAPRGNDGFGYDPLFYYAPYGKTFAEMSRQEKNGISHRGAALQKLAALLKERYSQK